MSEATLLVYYTGKEIEVQRGEELVQDPKYTRVKSLYLAKMYLLILSIRAQLKHHYIY
jgi:hypothetical protein